jgi:hypothetical protein
VFGTILHRLVFSDALPTVHLNVLQTTVAVVSLVKIMLVVQTALPSHTMNQPALLQFLQKTACGSKILVLVAVNATRIVKIVKLLLLDVSTSNQPLTDSTLLVADFLAKPKQQKHHVLNSVLLAIHFLAVAGFRFQVFLLNALPILVKRASITITVYSMLQLLGSAIVPRVAQSVLDAPQLAVLVNQIVKFSL